MSSTTENLGLTLPAGSEWADVAVLNENWEKIDRQVLRGMAAAAAYDAGKTYQKGDFCTQGGLLYRANQAIAQPEAWTAGHWTAISIMDVIRGLTAADVGALPTTEKGTAGGVAALGRNGQVPYAQTPHLTENVTLYVDASTGSDANPGTQQAPFASIQAAVDSLPRDLSGKNITIVIAPGTYEEDVVISGFYGAGGGYMELQGEPRGTHPTGDSNARKIHSISVEAAGVQIDIFGMYLYGNRVSKTCAFYCDGAAGVFLEYCTILSSGSSYGVRVGPNSQCYSYMNTMISGTSGEKFTYGFYMEAGAFLHISQTSIGGCITGVANPAVGEVGGIALVGYNVTFDGVTTEYYKLLNNGVIIRNGSEFV